MQSSGHPTLRRVRKRALPQAKTATAAAHDRRARFHGAEARALRLDGSFDAFDQRRQVEMLRPAAPHGLGFGLVAGLGEENAEVGIAMQEMDFIMKPGVVEADEPEQHASECARRKVDPHEDARDAARNGDAVRHRRSRRARRPSARASSASILRAAFAFVD